MRSQEVSPLIHYLRVAGLELSPETQLLSLPESCLRIRIDVGLSYDAPMTAEWLRRQPENLLVFCFEPIARNFERAKTSLNALIRDEGIKSKAILLPFALGASSGNADMYVTQDGGQSSLLQPTKTPSLRKEIVMIERLDSLLKLIDWEKASMVEFMKTDCQGTDIEVLLGAGTYLEKIAIVCTEADTVGYAKSLNSFKRINAHLQAFDFECINPRPWHRHTLGRALSKIPPLQRLYEEYFRPSKRFDASLPSRIETQDPTFVNSRFKAQVQARILSAYQRG